MKRDVQYYRKPVSVTAIKNDGTTPFADAIKANVPWEQIDIDQEHFLSTERGDLRPFTYRGEVTVRLRNGPKPRNLPQEYYCWRPGDWLVIDEDGPRHVTEEDFVRDYFFTSTETVTHMPLIEEIL
jgi:hypothetical protein